jgi:hypothetical protein
MDGGSPSARRYDSESDEEEMNEETKRLLQARAHAIELAGGQDKWDDLDDDATDALMREAQQELFGGFTPREDEDDDEPDPATLELIRIRDHAVLLAGGTAQWDRLSDEDREGFEAAAREALVGGSIFGSNFPPSLQMHHDSSNMGSPQEPSAPVTNFYGDDEEDDSFYTAPFAPVVSTNTSNTLKRPRVKTIYDSDSEDEAPPRARTKYDSDTDMGCSPAADREQQQEFGTFSPSPSPLRTVSYVAPNVVPSVVKKTGPPSAEELQKQHLQRVRNTAIELSGGQKEWDKLDASLMQSMMVEAEEYLNSDDNW